MRWASDAEPYLAAEDLWFGPMSDSRKAAALSRAEYAENESAR